MAHEIELKLVFPRKALARIRAHSIIAAAPKAAPVRTLTNTYYDTPGLKLKRARIGLRVRSHGRTRLQTIKCAADSTAGLSSRPEWEHPFRGEFDFSVIEDPALRGRLEKLAPKLAPRFVTRFRRETRVYEPDPTVRILIMIDSGEIIAGESRTPLHELELELERGAPTDLLRLAIELSRDLPLTPEDTSKAERGYHLYAGREPQPSRARAVQIDPESPPLDAFRTLATACLRHWQANLKGHDAAESAEFVHQLRVAVRRLRSLIQLFKPLLPPGFARHWNSVLRDNAARFGATRDFDVLCDSLLPEVHPAHADDIAAGVALAEAARAERARLRASPPETDEQGALLLQFMLDLHTLPADAAPTSLGEFARLRLERARKRLGRRRENARTGDLTALHATRIACKEMRYALEFFTPILRPRAGKRTLKTLGRIQQALGFMHDVDVARAHLLALADTPALREAAMLVCGWHGPRRMAEVERALNDIDALLTAKPAW